MEIPVIAFGVAMVGLVVVVGVGHLRDRRRPRQPAGDSGGDGFCLGTDGARYGDLGWNDGSGGGGD